jgi:hypothetical protein
MVIALVYKRKEKRKGEELAKKEVFKQAKISAIGIGLAGGLW